MSVWELGRLAGLAPFELDLAMVDDVVAPKGFPPFFQISDNFFSTSGSSFL